jgi:hypothetical protein
MCRRRHFQESPVGGWVKKCFQGLWQTALLSAEGKNNCELRVIPPPPALHACGERLEFTREKVQECNVEENQN